MKNKDLFQQVKKHLQVVAKQFKVKPSNVTSAQFWSVDTKIKEWEVRKVGGLINMRDVLFPMEEGQKDQLHARKKIKKWKYKAPKLTTFKVHELSIKEAFRELNLGKEDVLRVVVQPDTHVPEHDKAAVNSFCKFLSDYKPHGLINLGDFLEMGSVSRWENRQGSPRRLTPDVKAGRDVLEQIDKAAGPQCILKRFIIGNHEDWLAQYLVNNIPEVYDGLEDLGVELRIEKLLKLKEFGYRTIPLNEVFKLGHAHFIHGYYTGNGHAKKHLDVFGVNLYYGHLHDNQSYNGVSVNGVHEAASLGCLRTLNAEFLKGKPNNWSHSFSIFEFRRDGTYTRYSPIIVDGVFSYNGKVYKG